ncbi:hypothetical protein [Salsuginibacillus kocurii]|uniref:hypothetical protein n=1 Tax=Salsuginibacillus kocurii TaxID=427078 RepID=UPI00037C6AFE|nr:hypothetical protein [Salsuginibacillus kocurii]
MRFVAVLIVSTRVLAAIAIAIGGSGLLLSLAAGEVTLLPVLLWIGGAVFIAVFGELLRILDGIARKWEISTTEWRKRTVELDRAEEEKMSPNTGSEQ